MHGIVWCVEATSERRPDLLVARAASLQCVELDYRVAAHHAHLLQVLRGLAKRLPVLNCRVGSCKPERYIADVLSSRGGCVADDRQVFFGVESSAAEHLQALAGLDHIGKFKRSGTGKSGKLLNLGLRCVGRAHQTGKPGLVSLELSRAANQALADAYNRPANPLQHADASVDVRHIGEHRPPHALGLLALLADIGQVAANRGESSAGFIPELQKQFQGCGAHSSSCSALGFGLGLVSCSWWSSASSRARNSST